MGYRTATLMTQLDLPVHLQQNLYRTLIESQLKSLQLLQTSRIANTAKKNCMHISLTLEH